MIPWWAYTLGGGGVLGWGKGGLFTQGKLKAGVCVIYCRSVHE